MLVEKSISLSEYEKEQLVKSKKATWVTKLPMFLLEWFVVRNIESFRNPKDFNMPVIPKTDNEISHTLRTLDGIPNDIRINIFQSVNCGAYKLPLLFFIHGGGFLGGDSRVCEGLLRYIADKLEIICVSVDYNLAPEAKHPAALNDCCRALDYVISNFPVDNEKVFLAGDSAGGHLTAVITIKLTNEGSCTPKGQIMYYPVTDLDGVNKPSYFDKGLEYSSMRRGIKLSQRLYVPDKDSRKHPYVSPINADFDRPQPDALLLIAERDGLRSDGLEYGEKLKDAGGFVRCILYKGAYHSFLNDFLRSDIADDSAGELLTFIKERIVVN